LSPNRGSFVLSDLHKAQVIARLGDVPQIAGWIRAPAALDCRLASDRLWR
jgi:hypothetical protein